MRRNVDVPQRGAALPDGHGHEPATSVRAGSGLFFDAHRIANMFDDLPSDLPRLETLRTWHALWVDRIDAKIRQVREREEQQARATAAAEERAPDKSEAKRS